jgi:hypothetical protein
MDRREFLKMSALFAASCLAPGCAALSPRYVKPKPLALPDEKVLLTNCMILDVEKKGMRPEKSVLIRGAKILDLFHEAVPRNVAAHRAVNLKEAYLSPGLINGGEVGFL